MKLVGVCRLASDVESKDAANTKVAKFRVAANYGFGEKRRSEFFNIVAFGKTAESASKYLAKGSQIYLEADPKTESYEKDGVKRYITNYMVNELKFLDKKETKTTNEGFDFL